MSDEIVELGIADLTDAVEVGAGGFGTVYRARQSSLHRDVAVKMVSNTVKDEKVRIRFEREIAAMGMLSGHPNIVTVYDSGFTGAGQPYILMDYMEQGSLADRLGAEGPLPWQDALQIMVKVCGALETAHQAGVLHRDLKPENVLVSAYGEPKLGDFGIARLKGGPETGTSSLTASIEHVSPELLEAQQPSVASDVYALGSTLFKLLTGSAAFIRPSDESIVPALTRIRDEPVPDLRGRGIPDAVAGVVERAMAKDPAARYRSAVDMGNALRDVQRSLGLPATPMPVRAEDAAAARESTRTLQSSDIAASMEELGLRPSGEHPTAPPPPPGPGGATGPTGPTTAPQPFTGPPPQPYQPPQPGVPGHPQPQQLYQQPGGPGGPLSGPLSGAAPVRKATPWGPILAGIGVVVLLGGIGAGLLLSGGDEPTPDPDPDPSDEPTPDDPTDDPTTPEPPPTTDPPVEPTYETLFDDTGVLRIDAPDTWTDVEGGPWEIDGDAVGQQVTAAPDLERFRTTWNTPGLILQASEELQASFDPDTLLDAVSFADQCEYEGREPYSDPAYSGFVDTYSACGGTETTYTVIAAEPPSQERILLLQFQSVDEADADALDQALRTFFHTADPSGAPGTAAEPPPPPPPPPAPSEGG